MKRFSHLLSVSVLLLAGPAAAADWVRFELIDQSALPIVRASLNGSGGQRLVLDAGFPDFLLDTTIVEGLGLKLASRGEMTEIDFYGRPERVPVAYLQKLRIGDVDFSTVRTLLIEGEDGTGRGGLRSYGRIGHDVLKPLRLTVHYPRQLLYLEPSPEADVPEGGVSYRSLDRFLLVPVHVRRSGAELTANFIVDAGTSSTLVDRKWAEDNGFAPKKAPEAGIPLLEIGGFRAESVRVLTGDMKELPYEGQPVGVIGADILLGLSVTYDFARELIWLVKVEKETS